MDHFMVSNTGAGDEGWKWIDALGDNVCDPPIDGIFFPDVPLPTFLHYCQTFRVSDIGFWKREVDHKVFSCEGKMFLEPPQHLPQSNYVIKHNEVRFFSFCFLI